MDMSAIQASSRKDDTNHLANDTEQRFQNRPQALQSSMSTEHEINNALERELKETDKTIK